MGTSIYTWNPLTDSVIEESDELGNVLVTYTNEPAPFGPLVSENRGSQTSYYHSDALGSTRLMTNSSQAVTDTATYDAWGNKVASTGTNPTQYGWCGEWGYQADSLLGSDYVRARTYQPTVARWSSIDPLSTDQWLASRERSPFYAYGTNSPSGFIDPTGWQGIAPNLPSFLNQLPLSQTPFLGQRITARIVQPAPVTAGQIPPDPNAPGIAFIGRVPRLKPPPGVPPLYAKPWPLVLPNQRMNFTNIGVQLTKDEMVQLAKNLPAGTPSNVGNWTFQFELEPPDQIGPQDNDSIPGWLIVEPEHQKTVVPLFGGHWEIDPITGKWAWIPVVGIGW